MEKIYLLTPKELHQKLQETSKTFINFLRSIFGRLRILIFHDHQKIDLSIRRFFVFIFLFGRKFGKFWYSCYCGAVRVRQVLSARTFVGELSLVNLCVCKLYIVSLSMYSVPSGMPTAEPPYTASTHRESTQRVYTSSPHCESTQRVRGSHVRDPRFVQIASCYFQAAKQERIFHSSFLQNVSAKNYSIRRVLFSNNHQIKVDTSQLIGVCTVCCVYVEVMWRHFGDVCARLSASTSDLAL